MLVTALGHAGLRVRAGESDLLIDPWFSPEGAFLGSWFQFPDNSHVVSEELFAPTALVLSHEHLDHTDPWFLRQVHSDVPVIVPKYPSPVLRRKVLEGGPRQIIELDPWREMRLADGTEVFVVSEESPMNHDSAIVVSSAAGTLLNLNDARLSPTQLRAIVERLDGRVDVLALQGAGASWYPMCYRYSESRKAEVSRQKREAKFSYMLRVIRAVKPAVVVPFAGPPCFLDDDLQPFNAEMDGGIFPDQQEVQEFLRSKKVENTVLLLPGDDWDTATREHRRDEQWTDFSFSDRAAYIRDYAARRAPQIAAVRARHPEPERSLWEDFRAYFAELLEASPYFCERIGMRVGFEVQGPGGGSWAVDFRPESNGVYDELGSCGYVYTFESRWLPSILSGAVPWEDFFLSLRFAAQRDPDVYNDHLLGLLKFADVDSLRAVEAFERAMNQGETIEITHAGQVYRVQRRCPHAGLDLLETGEVTEDGVLRCLGHHYEFDLETGQCLNGASRPLRTMKIQQASDVPA